MGPFLAAWQFLTIFPVPKSWVGRGSGPDRQWKLEGAAAFFPAVGLLLGLLATGLDAALRVIFPTGLASALLIIAMIAFSGGMHADGLADTADGFFSSRPRERILEIMRDSRSGPMAVLALIAIFAVKWAALSELGNGPGAPRSWSVFLAPALGRWNLLFSMSLARYARSEGGLASVFITRDIGGVLPGSGILIALLAFTGLGIGGGMIVAAVAVFALLFASYCTRKIGGFTGDTLGAVCELTETLALLAAVAARGLHR